MSGHPQVPGQPHGPRPDFLARANREARARVAEDRARIADAQLKQAALETPPPPSFADALAADGVSVIAEIKRASPSRGHMAEIADPAALARAYVDGGAAAISVLTEPAHFGGSLADLSAVRATVDLPLIRKDFVVDAYQLWQARQAGAAAALLITASLDDDDLVALQQHADVAGLDVLVETHSAEEIRRAVAAHERAGTGRRLILGVNARNLGTLVVDTATVAELMGSARFPEGTILVGESGVRGPDDVRGYVAAGCDAVLVGEHVATADDPAAAVAALVAVRPPS